MKFEYKEIDHVQLAMPINAENKARDFYSKVLKFKEVKKPEPLQGRGGVWFQTGDIHLHLGVDEPFTPAKKAHPAFRVRNITALQSYLLEHKVDFSIDTNLPGAKRFYLTDPFGNRLEFLEWIY